MPEHEKLYTEDGSMHHSVYKVLMKEISNPYILSRWCREKELKGYWFYEWNANKPEGGNFHWVTYAFNKVEDANYFFETFNEYVEKEEDRKPWPDPDLMAPGVYG